MAQYVEPWPDLPKILDIVDVDSDKWAQYSAHAHPPLSWLWKHEGRNLAKLEAVFVESFSNTFALHGGRGAVIAVKARTGQISVLRTPSIWTITGRNRSRFQRRYEACNPM